MLVSSHQHKLRSKCNATNLLEALKDRTLTITVEVFGRPDRLLRGRLIVSVTLSFFAKLSRFGFEGNVRMSIKSFCPTERSAVRLVPIRRPAFLYAAALSKEAVSDRSFSYYRQTAQANSSRVELLASYLPTIWSFKSNLIVRKFTVLPEGT